MDTRIKEKGLNAISLFNGMSTGFKALENLKIKVNKCYSSEIKKHAIKLTAHHFPDVNELGDINNWKTWDIDYSTIDIIFSGSPCQDLSIIGKRAGINGSKSSLFYVFVEILNHCRSKNPNVIFLQENVGSAARLDIGIMSRCMGLYPARLNSDRVVAQMRDRYYWTNIRTKKDGIYGDIVSDIPKPEDRKIFLEDIVENGYVDRKKSRALLESESRGLTDMKKMKRRYYNGFGGVVFAASQRGREKVKDSGDFEQKIEINRSGKANCLVTVRKNNLVFNGEDVREYTKIELCRLQGFPDDYCDMITRNQAGSLCGDGWTLPMIEHILTFSSFYRELTPE